jgi:hypothetical protein
LERTLLLNNRLHLLCKSNRLYNHCKSNPEGYFSAESIHGRHLNRQGGLAKIKEGRKGNY